METTERAARFSAEIGREDLAALLRQSMYEFVSEEIWDGVTVPAIVLASPALYSDALEGLPEWDQKRVSNLTAAIENGGALEALVAQLHARQQERERLIAVIAEARTINRMYLDRGAIESTVMAQVARWRDLLTESVEDGRTLLREVLSGPLVFTREGKGYHFRGRVATGELVAGAVTGDATKVASPRGTESS